MVSYVKVPSTNTEKSFNCHSTLIDSLVRVVAGTDADESGATHQITKARVRPDMQVVVSGLKEMEIKIV